MQSAQVRAAIPRSVRKDLVSAVVRAGLKNINLNSRWAKKKGVTLFTDAYVVLKNQAAAVFRVDLL